MLTTNYEFTLEKPALNKSVNLKNSGAVSEQKYSLFRQFEISGKRFWHIHGDANHPQSIALGYEQYSGYLQNMRNYMVSGTKDNYKSIKLEALIKRLKRGDYSITSWIDLFFSHDIHILGLGLDFVEIHLWWLLTYRARVLNGHKLSRRNKIYYYYPRSREKDDKTKLRFLKAYGVVLRDFDDTLGRESYYNQILKKLESV
ncbi:SIR2 family protein [Geothermobacter hydrogeniphilus]|uniref:SIR2 family protein n=1 Tax=Geothermobacter hydrogeniphilus TaxID=1969733 RepID=UPI0022B93168|nr:SIR2 family protein [Geothermobacter hydrogeniphilus]